MNWIERERFRRGPDKLKISTESALRIIANQKPELPQPYLAHAIAHPETRRATINAAKSAVNRQRQRRARLKELGSYLP